MGYAVVLGEALVDLLDAECDGEPVYRQAIGGGPLNVAVGVARLGGAAQFVGSLGDDVLAGRIRDFLTAAGVGLAGAVTVPAPTTLAVATYAGPSPTSASTASRPPTGCSAPTTWTSALVRARTCSTAARSCCSSPPTLAAARRAWSLAPGLRVFDPNVRPRLLDGPAALDGLREVVAEFAAGAAPGQAERRRRRAALPRRAGRGGGGVPAGAGRGHGGGHPRRGRCALVAAGRRPGPGARAEGRRGGRHRRGRLGDGRARRRAAGRRRTGRAGRLAPSGWRSRCGSPAWSASRPAARSPCPPATRCVAASPTDRTPGAVAAAPDRSAGGRQAVPSSSA